MNIIATKKLCNIYYKYSVPKDSSRTLLTHVYIICQFLMFFYIFFLCFIMLSLAKLKKIATKTENSFEYKFIFENYRERRIHDFGIRKGFSSMTFMKIYVLCLFKAFF